MTLDAIFDKHGTDKGNLGHRFGRWYEPFLAPQQNCRINLLECGVQFGCSAAAWLDYFPEGQIYGVDIANEHRVRDNRFHFSVGNQRDAAFWSSWKAGHPRLHVIVDDAEHRADASRVMLDCLWDHLLSGGLYAIEDIGTWWDPAFASPLSGQQWLGELAAAVNWHGKSYGGKPHPADYVLEGLERDLDAVLIYKHLILLLKK